MNDANEALYVIFNCADEGEFSAVNVVVSIQWKCLKLSDFTAHDSISCNIFYSH